MFWLVWLGIGLYGMIPIVIFVLTLKIYIKNVETEKRIKKIWYFKAEVPYFFSVRHRLCDGR